MGDQNHALGRSRCGLTTNMSHGLRHPGTPRRFILTAGQVGDVLARPGSARRPPGRPSSPTMAYDSNAFAPVIADSGS